MSAWSAIYPASTAKRTDVEVSSSGLRLLSGMVTHSWGAQPATAELRYSGPKGFAVTIADVVPGLAPFTYVEVVMPGHRFYGLSKSDVAADSSGGSERVMQFVDLREFLRWDRVFGAFNIADIVMQLNSSTGRIERRRRYRHLLPVNWKINLWTYTDSPFTAAQILDYLFGAPTVHSSWLRDYHPDMGSLPAYEIDVTSGAELSSALLQVSEKLGLTFTLAGKFLLRWRRKGELLNTDANMPWANSPFPVVANNFVFPPGANNCRGGYAGSDNPSTLYVVGDANVYQVLNIELLPDWSAAWEQFLFEDTFVTYLYQHFTDPSTGQLYSGNPDSVVGMARARAAALKITVSEVATVLGTQFLDARKYAGKARNQLPAVLYIREVVFRAFRLPERLLSLPTRALRLLDRQLCAVSHDANGIMVADTTYPIDGNGYVIAKSIGLNSQAFASVRPEHFNLDEWILAVTSWGVVPFTIDNNSGDQVPFIVTQVKVCDIQHAVKSVNGMGVLDAEFQPSAVPVRACLTFAAEQFVAEVGSGEKWGAINESGLHREIVWDVNQGFIAEMPYADLSYPANRANALGNSLLLRQSVVANGGFTRPIDFTMAGTPLNGCIDRVTVAATPDGMRETVDFTLERTWGSFVPERHYDRLILDAALAPGQGQLREEQQLAGQLAVSLAANPRARETLRSAMHLLLGDEEPTVITHIESGTGSLAMGTPLWRKGSERLPVAPVDTTADHATFVGVTTRDSEAIGGRNQIRLFNDGHVLVRVMGPVSAGDGVGRTVGHDYLTKGTPAIGSAQMGIDTAEVKLIYVLLGGGGGGTGAALWD